MAGRKRVVAVLVSRPELDSDCIYTHSHHRIHLKGHFFGYGMTHDGIEIVELPNDEMRAE